MYLSRLNFSRNFPFSRTSSDVSLYGDLDHTFFSALLLSISLRLRAVWGGGAGRSKYTLFSSSSSSSWLLLVVAWQDSVPRLVPWPFISPRPPAIDIAHSHLCFAVVSDSRAGSYPSRGIFVHEISVWKCQKIFREKKQRVLSLGGAREDRRTTVARVASERAERS